MSSSFVNEFKFCKCYEGAAICWSKAEEDEAYPIFVRLLRSEQSLTERPSMRSFDNLGLLVLSTVTLN